MIAVFVRPARAGYAKTRLIPALTAQGAALLYRAMAADVLEQACLTSPGRVVCWVAGAIDDPCLDFVPEQVPRMSQPEADLGTRMRVALEHGIGTSGRCLVVGTDAPGLSTTMLAACLGALDTSDVVLGPSADGGYTSIAARVTHAAMFEGVHMSTKHTCSETKQACERAGLSVSLGEPWFDVDCPADLTTLHALIGSAPERAPRTAQTLAKLTAQRFDHCG